MQFVTDAWQKVALLPPPRRLCFRPSLSVCLPVCLLVTLREIWKEGCQWSSQQKVRFWWRSRTDSPDGGTDIATLVRRALAEVCTVPVLLVFNVFDFLKIACPDIGMRNHST